jgi:hypothetical protein
MCGYGEGQISRIDLSGDRLHQTLRSQEVQRALYIVSQHVQAHLGSCLWQRFGQEVRGSHPGLQSRERVTGRKRGKEPRGQTPLEPKVSVSVTLLGGLLISWLGWIEGKRWRDARELCFRVCV